MTLAADVLIVGASVAGTRCVEALRQGGYGGSLLLVDADTELPHDRPPLSKQFLAGAWDAERVRLLTAQRSADLDVDLRLGTGAVALDPAARTVTLADGARVRYGSVVIATGASARPSPWGASPRVLTVRNLTDSERLRACLVPGARVVVVGGGWIGAEIAATATGRHCRVLVVDVVANPYARSLGAELGEIVSSVHARHGVEARYGTAVAAVRRGPDGIAVELSDGSTVPADVVVVGIGAAPNTQWLVGSGLSVDDGVVCDRWGRAVGADGVWAAGDVARWGGHRHEHWTSAVEQARAVAHNIAAPLDRIPSAGDGYVWSDQYDWKIQLVGDTGVHLDCMVIGDVEQPRVAALFCDADGVLIGTATVNWPKAFLAGRRAIGSAAAAHAAALRDATANVLA
jgi:NADPH-dependent 2,4-dienoyl-CoA reductase/sulfur reductase-like enzyme